MGLHEIINPGGHNRDGCKTRILDLGHFGGSAPNPPGFNALMPIPRFEGRGKAKRGAIIGHPASVLAPGSALGLLPSIALSSAQADTILSRTIMRKQICVTTLKLAATVSPPRRA